MPQLIAEIIGMRSAPATGSVARRLADRCLELCVQELTANDATGAALPDSAREELREASGGGLA